ncbi:MAG: AraC family ligand binding domain-containing protein, partial [Chloroflexota bacterium]
MEIKSADIISPIAEGHYGYFSLVEHISTQAHTHEFYEIFLVIRGEINHHINQTTETLSSGTLVFIRPDDVHYFSQWHDDNCELLNIAFLKQTFDAICIFLDDACKVLLEPERPPHRILRADDRQRTVQQWKQWGQLLYRDEHRARVRLRALLATLLTEYFLTPFENINAYVPDWLQVVCAAMRERKNTIEGRDALLRLANRSPEYIGRCFKDYMSTTPSQFINGLRIDYASDL